MSDFLIDQNIPPLIAPGRYAVMLDHYQTAIMFGKAPKLILHFKVTSFGEGFGSSIPRYYNVQKLIGKAQKNGRFKVSKTGDFLREYLSLFPEPAKRLDRLPMSRFKNLTIEAEIVTVKEARGRSLPESLRYSKIAKLVRTIEDD
jgi:hypothetical protein